MDRTYVVTGAASEIGAATAHVLRDCRQCRGRPPETMPALNYFGAVATLEGLRPLLDGSTAPRAKTVSSTNPLGPTDAGLIEACLASGEASAIAAAKLMLASAKSTPDRYGSAKRALNCWCRRVAVSPPCVSRRTR